MKLAGWGRYPVLEARVHRPRSVDAVRQLVVAEPSLIARGNGRAYGDSAINTSATIEMCHLNRMMSFEPASGQLVAEAGVLLGDIIAAFLPRGWFPMVTPGTKFVTLGGAIAADVHGKNHHRDGSFRTCVDWLDVMGPDGQTRRCSPQDDASLFDHTLGGMGLTGIILRAAIRLRPVETAWIRQTTTVAPNLKAAMAAFEAAQDATYSVAWIDCLGTGGNLGRSLVMLGEHAVRADLAPQQAQAPLQIKSKRKLRVRMDFPAFTLNSLTVRAFNAFYYWAGARKTGTQLVDWDSYFYPLDAILAWNRIYGRKGFAQFQCALPLDKSEIGLTALLSEIARAGSGSFLGVLKRFGTQDGAFSFPMEGYTLALDFPVTSKSLALLERLDQITIAHGGRFYLAKDSRMTSVTLSASDPRMTDFQAYRDREGFTNRFRSAQSERLAL
ncbi:FAD-dependent oxidoreductase [Marimonas sp. MJW-29]|uniref:FAD-dependent oxidoreductase n=1 Tax=Sulfitobacter sediminis TaxID=3234186 RepID=A0ABV3RMW0_9RHOB